MAVFDPRIWLLSLFLWAAILLGLMPARANDPTGKYKNSPYAKWFKEQHNQQGDWCCDEADGNIYYGDYELNEDGSVTLKLEAGDHKLPAHMVLKGANPTGHAVWWHLGATDYCFAPGSLT